MDLTKYSDEQLNRILKTQLQVENPEPLVDEILAELERRQESKKIEVTETVD